MLTKDEFKRIMHSYSGAYRLGVAVKETEKGDLSGATPLLFSCGVYYKEICEDGVVEQFIEVLATKIEHFFNKKEFTFLFLVTGSEIEKDVDRLAFLEISANVVH